MRSDRSRSLRLPLALAAGLALLALPAAADPDDGNAEILVLMPAPPPVAGWEQPVSPSVEVVGADGARVVVLVPPPEPMPVARRLDGVDIRTHPMAAPAGGSAIREAAWQPGAPSAIPVDDWRREGEIPTAGAGSALASQSWNPAGAGYRPSRIRSHAWFEQQAE